MRTLSSRGLRLAALLAFVAGFIFVVRGSIDSVNAADKPCLTKKFATPQVKKACTDGGQKAAKKLMKDVVKKARKADDDKVSGCLDCHDDLKTFKRSKDAVKLLKKYL
jgi:ABC-type sugar transport system substrate-binding protein